MLFDRHWRCGMDAHPPPCACASRMGPASMPLSAPAGAQQAAAARCTQSRAPGAARLQHALQQVQAAGILPHSQGQAVSLGRPAQGLPPPPPAIVWAPAEHVPLVPASNCCGFAPPPLPDPPAPSAFLHTLLPQSRRCTWEPVPRPCKDQACCCSEAVQRSPRLRRLSS